MIDVSFSIGETSWSQKLSTFSVQKDPLFRKIVTTLDDVDHPYPGTFKTVIDFSLVPLTDEESANLYNDLSAFVFYVTYTDPHIGETRKKMRLNSNLSSAFALRSIDGNRYYKGGTIQFRQV